MHALDFYTSTCRCVMQADPDNPTTLVELRRLLPCLRQALGCYVCFRLLKDPMGPNHNVCRHSVCLNCLGGKMKLKPACSWCKDHYQFVPNPLLKILVTCFKKLCVYIYCSPIGNLIRNSSINGETNHLLNIVQEGMDFQDDYVPSKPQTPSIMLVNGTEDQTPSVMSVNGTEEKSETIDVVADVQASTANGHVEMNGKEDIKVTPETKETIEAVPLEKKNTERVVPLEKKNTERAVPLEKKNTERDRKVFRMPSVELSDINLCNKKNNHDANRKRIVKATDRAYENMLNTTGQNKSAKKPVIFLKRATINKKSSNNKVQFKSKLASVKALRTKKVQVKKFNTRSKQEAPTDLERIDNSEPSLKKVKVELQPPELKPLSSCNCGKSGNFNQLTCIGQRCPCYSMKLPCVGCKCKGCRNPKKGPDYKGMNTIGSSTVLRSGTRNATEALCVNM